MKKILVALLAVSLVVSLAACGGSKTASESSTASPEASISSQEESTSEESPDAEPVEPVATTNDSEIKLGQVYYAAHGTKAFAVATAVVQGDVIVDAFINEYQFMPKADAVGVPNSDSDFAAGFAGTDKVLASKRANSEYYSNAMASAGSTVAIADNFDTIQNFAVSKTIQELEAVVAGTPEEIVDAVAGATLGDTPGYLQAIIEAAKAASTGESAPFSGDVSQLKIGQVDYAAHGTKAFAIATVVTDGDQVVLSYVDELQFLEKGDVVGVPNSESDFGIEGYAEGLVLVSKRVNSDFYSGMMAGAGSTVAISDNFNAIQQYTEGKTAAEITALSGKPQEEIVDTVAGATLVDTLGYLAAIDAAMATAK